MPRETDLDRRAKESDIYRRIDAGVQLVVRRVKGKKYKGVDDFRDSNILIDRGHDFVDLASEFNKVAKYFHTDLERYSSEINDAYVFLDNMKLESGSRG